MTLEFYPRRMFVTAQGRSVLIGGRCRKDFKQQTTLFVNDSSGAFDDLMSQLGKHKTGKGCFYIKRLSDVDEAVLEQVIAAAIERCRLRGACT